MEGCVVTVDGETEVYEKYFVVGFDGEGNTLNCNITGPELMEVMDHVLETLEEKITTLPDKEKKIVTHMIGSYLAMKAVDLAGFTPQDFNQIMEVHEA